MLSKPTLRKMLNDVTAPVIIDITVDMLHHLQATPPGDAFQDGINNVELAVAELKKKTVPAKAQPKRPTTPTTQTIGSGPQVP